MAANALEALISREFTDSLGACPTPQGLWRCLQRSKHVKDVRDSLARGEITEEGLRRFVDSLQLDFRRGTQFVHEHVLAAIAVALESRRTRFAEDFLLDLARLKKISELDMAPRVAGLCLSEQMKLPRATKKRFRAYSKTVKYWSGGIIVCRNVAPAQYSRITKIKVPRKTHA